MTWNDCFYDSHQGAVVAEGGRVTIDRSKLDASNLLRKLPEMQQKGHHIMYRVISLPKHGALSLQGHNLSRYEFYSTCLVSMFS